MRIRLILPMLLFLLMATVHAQQPNSEIDIDTSDWVRAGTSIDGHVVFSKPNYQFRLYAADPIYHLHPSGLSEIEELSDEQYWVDIDIADIGDSDPGSYLQNMGFLDNRMILINGREAWMGTKFSEASYFSDAVLMQYDSGKYALVVVHNPLENNEERAQLAYGFASAIVYRPLENIVTEPADFTESYYNIEGTFTFQHPADLEVSQYGLSLTNHDHQTTNGYLITTLAPGEYHLNISHSVYNPSFDAEGFVNSGVDYSFEEPAEVYSLDGRYVVMNQMVEQDTGNLRMELWISLENGLFTRFTAKGNPANTTELTTLLLGIAQTTHMIDPHALTIDTSYLSESYGNEVFGFDYPADWYIVELENLVVLQDELYTEMEVSPSFEQDTIGIPMSYGTLLSHDTALLLDFKVMSAEDYASLSENNIMNQQVTLLNDETFTGDELVQLEDARRLIWSETAGFPHDGFYYAHEFWITIELGNDLYGVVHAYAYGGVSLYFPRQQVLSIASTMYWHSGD